MTQNEEPASPRPQLSAFDIKQIDRRGLADLPALVRRWFPQGKLVGGKFWSTPNPKVPEDPDSRLSIDMQSGSWRDFRSGDKGRGIVSLVSFLTGMNSDEARQKLLLMQKD